MEYAWYNISLKPPTDKYIGKEVIVTVYNPLWETKYKSMVMKYDVEIRKGFRRYIWILTNGSKMPSTWEIIEWMPFPEPARKDE